MRYYTLTVFDRYPIYSTIRCQSIMIGPEVYGIVISTSPGPAHRGHDLRRLRGPHRKEPEQAAWGGGEREFCGGVGAGDRPARGDFAGCRGRGDSQDRVFGARTGGRVRHLWHELRGVRHAYRKGPEPARGRGGGGQFCQRNRPGSLPAGARQCRAARRRNPEGGIRGEQARRGQCRGGKGAPGRSLPCRVAAAVVSSR